MNISVLIADDQPGIRSVLGKIIDKTGGFEIVGEAENGVRAMELFEQLRPQVIFLDVEMPEMTGVECARRIFDIAPTTCLVFATAHDQYMKQAFSVYAFDYLIKPFDITRVQETLERLKSDLAPREASPTSIIALPHDKKKLMVKNRDGISVINTVDIILIQREDRNTVIYTSDERVVTSESLTELSAKLDPSVFFRSHKSYIINLNMVHKIYPYGRWTYIIKLKNTDQDALITMEKMNEMENLFT